MIARRAGAGWVLRLWDRQQPALLAPDAVMRGDGGTARPGFTKLIRGARDVAAQALTGAWISPFARTALVNYAAGAVAVRNGRPLSVMAFTVTGGKIAAIDVIADPDRLHLIAPELINQPPASETPDDPSDPWALTAR